VAVFSISSILNASVFSSPVSNLASVILKQLAVLLEVNDPLNRAGDLGSVALKDSSL
jgi:hypothetical protein